MIIYSPEVIPKTDKKVDKQAVGKTFKDSGPVTPRPQLVEKPLVDSVRRSPAPETLGPLATN